jgi:hypothetical protein
MKTIYRSFAEIDQQLKILRLQRQINKESLILHLQGAKSNLYPRKTIGILTFLIQKIIIPMIKKKRLSKIQEIDN